MGLIVSGLPAQGTQATTPEKTAPSQPPVVPPPAGPQKAAPAPPFPVGPVPALPKVGEEIVGRRTERSKTFATGTFGQYRTEVYAERVHYKDATGAYQAIDAELGASKDGVRRSKANAFVLELAEEANAAAVARLRLDDQVSVGFAFEGARGVKAKADRSVSTYAGVSPGVDVRLTSRPDGLKEELVLASAAAGDRFLFPLELKGLTAAIDASGDVVYRDKSGAERARTPHGFMTDSAVDARSGEAPMSLGVTYALVPHARGTALEVRLDRAWLTDPARTWPVVVDPQLTVNTYGEDTYVMSGFSRDNSYDLDLKVGTYDGGAHIARSFVKFDTASINGKVVNSAQFHIGERHSWNCAYGWPSVHRVTGGWDGRTMRDWPGAPFDPNPAGGVISATGPCAGRTVVYDVTSAAAHWAANTGSSHGLVLEANHSDNNAWKKFHSSETGNPPRLEVTWTEPPPPPSNNNPIGYLDAVYPFVNGLWPKGWAIDPNTVDPIWLHVYVDGGFMQAMLANKSRPDVGAAYPGYGDNHGFEDLLAVSPGYHDVCVYAINVGAGTHSALGCQGATVPGRSAQEPFGYLDAVDTAPGGAQVKGWTIDADTVAPITVQVWADLNYVTTLDANTYRPAVGAAYPGYGNNHGFDGFVHLSPGYHNVCVFGMNTGGGANNALLGCRQVTVPAANPPAAPTNAVASVNTDNTVKVTWARSAADGGSPIDYYAIYAYNAADSTWTGAYTVECATCTSTTFTGLALGKSYWFPVYAHNGSAVNGGFSAAATSNTVTVPPALTTTTSSSTTVPPNTTTTLVPTTTTTVPTTTTTVPATTTTVPPTTTTTVPPTTTTTVPPGPAVRSRNGPAVSDDGMYVAFSSAASNLVSGDTNGAGDVFLFDRDAGRTIRVSVSTGGGQANGTSKSVSISASAISDDPDTISEDPVLPPPSNPGLVAFESAATNLIPGDGNGANDVFVRDVLADTTTLASISTSGQPGNAASYGSAISADGRYVSFASAASDLVAEDTNDQVDVFVRDLVSGTTERLSVTTSGTQGDAGSADPAISADGNYVAFSSVASNLVAGDTNDVSDIFIRDRAAGTTTRLSVGAQEEQGNGASVSPAMSADGRSVAFSSAASNLVVGDTNSTDDVFLHDRAEGFTARTSVAPSAAPADGPSFFPSVSPDGRFVAFESAATNLVNADSNEASDIFEVEVARGTTSRLSVDDVPGIGQGNAASFRPSVSSDGTFAAFETYASNFDDDDNGALDVYLHVWTDLRQAGTSPSFAAESSTSTSGSESASCAAQQPGGTTESGAFAAMETAQATDPEASPRESCVVTPISQSVQSATERAQADGPFQDEDVDCDDGEVNVGNYPVNIRTSGLSPEEVENAMRYALRSNSWLAKAARIKGGPITIKGTKGELRVDANAAVRAERLRAEELGQDYVNQVGHVPDTAVTGQAVPPCGWLDQGASNQRAGGSLGARVGDYITHYLVDGALPVLPIP